MLDERLGGEFRAGFSQPRAVLGRCIYWDIEDRSGFDKLLRGGDSVAFSRDLRGRCCVYGHFLILPYCWSEFLLDITDAGDVLDGGSNGGEDVQKRRPS